MLFEEQAGPFGPTCCLVPLSGYFAGMKFSITQY